MKWERRWARRLVRPGVREGISLNDDFANHASDVPATLAARRPAWIGVQEGKRRDYADLVDDERYGVVQRMTNDATKGVAVIYDRRQVTPIGNHRDDPTRRGHGYQQLTPAANGILARGVAWQDVKVGRRRVVRLASTHRLPQRDRGRWDTFDRELDEWIERSPIPVWLTADFNTPHPTSVRVRGRMRLKRIDGHLITRGLSFVSQVKALAKRISDHRAVTALVKIHKRKRKP